METISMWKNVGRFTPAPRNRQGRFTPQIVCMIYPPEITREDLPLKLSVRFTPPKSPGKIYPQIVCTIYPPEIARCQGRFTPQIAKYDLPPPMKLPLFLPSCHLKVILINICK